MTSEGIDCHIRSLFYLKIHFILDIFFCLKSDLIKIWYECYHNEELRSYGQILSLFKKNASTHDLFSLKFRL